MRMTKKITSLVLAVMMIVSMLVVASVSASAAVVTDPSAAKVKVTTSANEVIYYDALPSLTTSSLSKGTVELLDDVTANTTWTTGVFGTTTTLDLGGKTLTFTKNAQSAISLRGSSNLTIKNGTIVMDTNYPNGNGISVQNTSVLNIEADATLIAKDELSVVSLFGGIVNSAGNLSAEDSFAIATNGSNTAACSINITGGYVKSDNASAIYQPYGDVTISGGVIEGETALYVKAGTTLITGGTFKGTGADTAYTFNGNGANGTGDAIVIDNCGYPQGSPQINISGGTFESENADAVASYKKSDDASYPTATQPAVTGFITGGTFENSDGTTVEAELLSPGVSATEVTPGSGVYTTEVAADANFVVDGQVFDDFADARNYARDNYPGGATIKMLKDIEFTPGAYGVNSTVTLDLNGHKLSSTTPMLSVQLGGDLTVINGTVECTDGVQAIQVLADSKLTVGKDAVIKSNNYPVLAVAGSTVVIEKNASVESVDSRAIYNYGGDVTIKDQATVTTANSYAVECQKNAKLTVKGGVIEGVNGIGMWGADGDYAAEINIEGGTVNATDAFCIFSNGNNHYDYDINVKSGTLNTPDVGIYHCNQGTLTISGGTINAGTGVHAKCGNTVVTGGTINATGAKEDFVHNSNGSQNTGDAIYVENCNYPGGSPTITISKGTFNSANGNAVSSYVQDDSYPEITNFVTGGTFSDDSAYDYVADAAFATKAASGKVTISATVPTTSTTIDPAYMGATGSFKNFKIVGAQQKIDYTEQSVETTGNDVTSSGVRFVTVVNEGMIKGDNIAEYGFVVAAFNNDADPSAAVYSQLNVNGSGNGAKVINCTGSSNALSEDNGIYETSTTFKYVTCAVNGMSAGDRAIARFYVKTKDGNVYYSDGAVATKA